MKISRFFLSASFLLAVGLALKLTSIQSNAQEAEALGDQQTTVTITSVKSNASSSAENAVVADQNVVDDAEAGQTDDERFIFIKPQDQQKIDALRVLYRDQVEVYRSAEKNFAIAKSQLEQVQTLNSLEEAIKQTKAVMFERNRVMITYFELTFLVLDTTQGVELSLKEVTKKEILEAITSLKLHQSKIETSQNREAMEVLALEFEPIAKNYQETTYKALSLIKLGGMQALLDRTAAIKKEVTARHSQENVSEVVNSRRQRAYAEIDKKLAANTAVIRENVIEMQDIESKPTGSFGSSFYESVLKDLGPVYVAISQLLDHSTELLTL